MLKFLCIFVLSCLAPSIYAGSVSFINPCKAEDQKCLNTSSQAAVPVFVKGLPEFDIPSLDPVYVGNGESTSPNLVVKYKNVNVYGLNNAKFVKAELDKSVMKFVIETPAKIIGQYELKGKVLFLDVLGNGDTEIKSDKLKIDIDVKYTTVKGADGKDHWKLTGYDYKYDFVEKCHIKLTNLFNGDEEKAKPIQAIFDTNWKEIIEEIGEPIIKNIINILVENVNKFFKAVPRDELQLA